MSADSGISQERLFTVLVEPHFSEKAAIVGDKSNQYAFCLLYTSPSPRDATLSRMPSSA